MTLQETDSGIYLDDSVRDELSNADGIIFDCDGVLVDITESYDLAIMQTTRHVLKRFCNIKDSIPVDSAIIDGFKSTGGFNDEVDLTYAAIISLAAADKLGKNQSDFIYEVISNADSSGISSVEKYLESQVDISDIKQKLDYPGPHHKNPLYKIFDQLFYGPLLYYKLFKQTSEFTKPGLIENDAVIFSQNLGKKLEKRFQEKIGIVTGRGLESIRYSMKKLLDSFNLKHSAFLEDEPRKLAKPNPESLLRAIEGLNIRHCIYVGDSMEDFLMAQKATQMGHKTTFCGIIGTSKEPERKLKLFEKNNASCVLESINLLPKILNLE